MTGKFSGKVAVITGGGSGIGKATAKAFVEEGADVLIIGRSLDGLKQAVQELGGEARNVHFSVADVRNADQVTAAFIEVDRRFGGLDILFNNAGINLVGSVDQLSEEDWDNCLDINLKGAFLTSREAIPRMRRRGGGVIVNNASNAGLVARAIDPAYCASKAGLIMLTRSMALAHAADRIRVNAICPGPVSETGLLLEHLEGQPDPNAAIASILTTAPLAAAMGRMITPEEVAAAVLFLCSDEAQMITGAVLSIDGGKSAGIQR
mgnify:CR=1 FL=1